LSLDALKVVEDEVGVRDARGFAQIASKFRALGRPAAISCRKPKLALLSLRQSENGASDAGL
jgi:hypothetical protein